MLDALATGEAGGGVGARIEEFEAKAADLERRLVEVAQELAGLERDAGDEVDLRKALSLFDPIWDVLFPMEQARIIRLLIGSIDYDGRTGKLGIEFAAGGIEALAGEIDSSAETV